MIANMVNPINEIPRVALAQTVMAKAVDKIAVLKNNNVNDMMENFKETRINTEQDWLNTKAFVFWKFET